VRSAGLRPVEYAEHDDFIAVLVEFMNDDVRQARRHDADAAELGEFAEPIGLGEDVFGDVDCGLWVTLLYIKTDTGNVRERFECEAHSHMVVDEISRGGRRLRHRSRGASYRS
jgi:hypothetical protein